jgi:hypothetical protein
MIYLIIKIFGVVVMTTGTHGTMEECVKSLDVLNLPLELSASAECSRVRQIKGVMTDKQVELLNKWVAEQRRNVT